MTTTFDSCSTGTLRWYDSLSSGNKPYANLQMRVINARAGALPDCSVGTKRPAAQNGAGGGGKRGKMKKDAAGRLSAMGRSKSPTPFDEDSNSTLHAQPQPWQPGATKKDVDVHSTKSPVKGGPVPKKTTKFDDIQRPTGK